MLLQAISPRAERASSISIPAAEEAPGGATTAAATLGAASIVSGGALRATIARFLAGVW